MSSEVADFVQKRPSPDLRSAEVAQGITRPIPQSARDLSLVPVSGRRTSGQVRDAPQAQAIGDVAKPLPAGREEAAKEAALAQFVQPRLPGLGGCAQPFEDPGHLARDRRLSLAE